MSSNSLTCEAQHDLVTKKYYRTGTDPDGPSSTAQLSVYTLEPHSPVHSESSSLDPGFMGIPWWDNW